MPTKPRAKPERLPERKAVTIIAGFRCVDGVVVCADTQETSDVHKRNVTKVIVYPQDADASSIMSHADLMASFCGAGNGDFIEMLIRKAWESAKRGDDLEQACDFAEQEIKDVYAEYGKIYQRGKCPSVSLIYGIKMNGGSRLFKAVGPVVNPIDTYSSNGQGYYMADFLAERMYSQSLTVHQCAILAAYVLFQAKEHVDGCGGESHIAVLRHDAPSGKLDRHRVEGITKILEHVDKRLGSILLAAGNLSHGYETITDMSLDNLGEFINSVRADARKEVKNVDDFLWVLCSDIEPTLPSNSMAQALKPPRLPPDTDELGFRPLDPQTSEDQP